LSGFTLEELIKALDDERRERGLMPLPESFYKDAGAYMSRLLAEAEVSEGMKKKILTAELRGIVGALQELHVLRRIKALTLISTGKSPGVSREELNEYNEIRKIVERMEAVLVWSSVATRPERSRPHDTKRVACIVLIDLPERIVGEDRRTYGPFLKGDVVYLPEKNAELLIKHEAARRIEIAV